MSDVSKGYYQLPRGLMDSAWSNGPFSRWQAFVWLVENAAWKQVRYDVLGRMITVERGQLCASIRGMASRWKWEKMQVARFLSRLERETLIRTSTEHGRTLITLLEYDSYQGGGGPDPLTKVDSPETPDLLAVVAKPDTKEEGNKLTIPEVIVPPKADHAVEQAFAAYNQLAAEIGIPAAGVLNADRRKKIKKRLTESGIDGWTRALDAIRRSGFCRGENDRGWKANLDFMVQPKSFTKLLEDTYLRQGERPGQGALPLLTAIDGGKTAPRPELSEDDSVWKVAIEIFLEQGLWDARRGPKPGESGCEAPAFLIRQLCPHLDRTRNQVQAVGQ